MLRNASRAEVLAAIGLTPRQVMATLVVNTAILTAFGALLGTAGGLAVAPLLVNAQGQASGLGWGIAVMPSVGAIAAMLALTLLVATAAALLLALRAARAPEPLAPPHCLEPKAKSNPQIHHLERTVPSAPTASPPAGAAGSVFR